MTSAEQADAPVPFFAVDWRLRPIVEEALTRVLDSGRYILGEENKLFESEFARFLGVEFCVGVGNGSDALELALRCLGVGQNDEVILAANAGFYGSIAVRNLGAVPLYVDVDPNTLCMSPTRLSEKLVGARPKAIVVTHLYGQMADIESLVAIADAKQIPVVEDCAQAHGAQRSGRTAGSFGTMGCFSFYPTKNLGALGDGGAVVTSNSMLVESLTRLRQYGWSEKYRVSTPGGRNSRLDEVQAAILRAKLPRLSSCNLERRDVAGRYNAAFDGLPFLRPPSTGDDFVGHLYVIRTQQRRGLREHLTKSGILSEIHYPIPDHKQPAYRTQDVLQVTEKACHEVLSLPCFPGMSNHQVQRVIDAVSEYFA